MEEFRRIGKDLYDLQVAGARAAKNLEKIAQRKGELIHEIAQAGANDTEVPLRDLERQLQIEKRYLRKLRRALDDFLETLTGARGYLKSLNLQRSTGKEITRYLDIADNLAGQCKHYLEARQRIVESEINHVARSEGREFDADEFKKMRNDLKKEVSLKRQSHNSKSKLEELKKQYQRINRIPEVHDGGIVFGHLVGGSAGMGLMVMGHPIIGFLAWAVVGLYALSGPTDQELSLLKELA